MTFNPNKINPLPPRKWLPPPPLPSSTSSKNIGIGDDDEAMNISIDVAPTSELDIFQTKTKKGRIIRRYHPRRRWRYRCPHLWYRILLLKGWHGWRRNLDEDSVHTQCMCQVFLSNSKVAEIFKDRFNNAYHKWLCMERCIVREAFGEALVEKNWRNDVLNWQQQTNIII